MVRLISGFARGFSIGNQQQIFMLGVGSLFGRKYGHDRFCFANSSAWFVAATNWVYGDQLFGVVSGQVMAVFRERAMTSNVDLSAITVPWQTIDEAGHRLRALCNVTGAVEGCLVRLDAQHALYDGGPIYRQAWFDGARNAFVCSATGVSLNNVLGWALGGGLNDL
jgi:hypothetical protein